MPVREGLLIRSRLSLDAASTHRKAQAEVE